MLEDEIGQGVAVATIGAENLTGQVEGVEAARCGGADGVEEGCVREVVG